MNCSIFFLMIINSLQSCGYSIIQSIFPILGKQFNISDSISGIIFAAYPIANTIVIPLVPYLLEKFPKNFTFMTTLFSQSCMIIIFGIITFSPSKEFFEIFSFIIRFIQGIGVGISSTINYTLAVSICKNEDEVNRNISLMELSYSIGLAIGPVMGTYLYEGLGWEVPFFLLGGLNLFSSFTIINMEIKDCEKSDYSNFFKAVFNWKILLTEIASIIVMGTVNFYEPVFENYLIDNFGLGMKTASLFFDIQIVSFFVSLSLFGKLINKIGTKISISFGLFLGFIFVNLLGPISILPKKIHIIVIGLIFLGPSEAFVILPSIEDYMNTLMTDLQFSKEYSNDLSCTIFNFVSNLGDTIGPLIGGILSDYYGFPQTCFIISIGLFICFFFFSILNFLNACKKISFKDKYNCKILSDTDNNINDPFFNSIIESEFDNNDDCILDVNNNNNKNSKSSRRKMTFESQTNTLSVNDFSQKYVEKLTFNEKISLKKLSLFLDL